MHGILSVYFYKMAKMEIFLLWSQVVYYSRHFILCLAAALKSPDIVGQLKEITHPSRDEFADLISSELHRQLKPFKDALEAKDREIKELKKTISDQNDKLDQLEQHGRRDSLRIAGIPQNEASDVTDTAVLTLCAAIKVDPPVQAQDIAVSHRAGKAATGKPRQILVKFATRNIRKRVFRAKKKHQNWTWEKRVFEEHLH